MAFLKAGLLTCGCYLVDGSVGLVGGVTGDVVAEADRCQRDETIIKRIEEIPLRFQISEHARGHQEEET